MRTFLLAVLLCVAAAEARAACVCRCVNGVVEAVCASAVDLRPVCSPAVCPVVPPRVAPVNPPTVPPVGTAQCRPEQVLNPATGRYEWRQLCR
ncbi:MAG TPA: hypothetical protein VMV26_02775 [Alphaproteobacteria bacterium]|nr:hypothetical protein [Alphaproteobacteria bacterium]